MPNIVNVSLVDLYKEEYKDVNSVLLFNYQGIGVKGESVIRGHLKEINASFNVVKNSVAKIAFKGTDLESAESVLNGPVAVISGGEDIVSCAKAVQKFIDEKDKESPYGVFVGAVIDGSFLDAKAAEGVYKMPSKKEVQASIVSLAMGPGSKVASALNGPSSKIAGLVKAVIEKREEEAA